MAEKDLNQTGYVLGILSIIFGLVSPLAGLAMGIIGLFHTKHKSELTRKSKILNIIGIIVSVIVLALAIVVSYTRSGSALSSSLVTP